MTDFFSSLFGRDREGSSTRSSSDPHVAKLSDVIPAPSLKRVDSEEDDVFNKSLSKSSGGGTSSKLPSFSSGREAMISPSLSRAGSGFGTMPMPITSKKEHAVESDRTLSKRKWSFALKPASSASTSKIDMGSGTRISSSLPKSSFFDRPVAIAEKKEESASTTSGSGEGTLKKMRSYDSDKDRERSVSHSASASGVGAQSAGLSSGELTSLESAITSLATKVRGSTTVKIPEIECPWKNSTYNAFQDLEKRMAMTSAFHHDLKKFVSRLQKLAVEETRIIAHFRGEIEKLNVEGSRLICTSYASIVDSLLASSEDKQRVIEDISQLVLQPISHLLEECESKRIDIASKLNDIGQQWNAQKNELEKSCADCSKLYKAHEDYRNADMDVLLIGKNEKKLSRRAQKLTKSRKKAQTQFLKTESLMKKHLAWKTYQIAEINPLINRDIKVIEDMRFLTMKNSIVKMGQLLSMYFAQAKASFEEGMKNDYGFADVKYSTLDFKSDESEEKESAYLALPCNSAYFMQRSPEESVLYELIAGVVLPDDEEELKAAGLPRGDSMEIEVSESGFKRTTDAVCKAWEYGSWKESVRKDLDSLDKSRVLCAKVLTEIEVETISVKESCPPMKFVLRPGEVIRVNSFGAILAASAPRGSISVSASGSKSKRGSLAESSAISADKRALWMGYPVERKRFFQIMFPNDIVAIIEISKSMPLSYVLEIPVGAYLFHQFLKKEHSDENYDFWKVASAFEFDNQGTEPRELAKKIIALAKEFIEVDSPRMINIKSDYRFAILESVSKMSDPSSEAFDSATVPPSSLFNAAALEVLQVMDRDSFKRFTMSPLFDEFLSRMTDSPARV